MSPLASLSGGLRWLYVSFVATGMFVVRMVLLGFMALLQLTVGGAEIRPAQEADAA